MSGTLQKLEEGLKIYYAEFGMQYNGALKAFIEERGFEDEDLQDDFDEDPEECTIITDFDDNFPLKGHIDVNDANAVLQEKFKIMKSIFDTGRPPNDMLLMPIDVKISKAHIKAIDIKKTHAIYKQQTPDLYAQCQAEQDVMYLLTARTKNDNYPLVQSMHDAYARDRLDAKLNNAKAPLAVVGWFEETDLHTHLSDLTQQKKVLSDIVTNGMKGFANRICPLMVLHPQIVIDDDPGAIATYISGVSQFIKRMLTTSATSAPFQLDMVVAVKDLTKNVPVDDDNKDNDNNDNKDDTDNDDNDDDDVDDDDSDDDDIDDIDGDDLKDAGVGQSAVIDVGDVKARLKANNCIFDSAPLDDIKQDLSRPLMDIYNQFRGKLKKKPNNMPNKSSSFHTAFNAVSYPQKKRFGIFIDRRSKLPNAKDEIIFFEPPYDCDTIPSGDKLNGQPYAPEWFFESSRKCLLPGIGDQKQDWNNPDNPGDAKLIDVKEPVGGSIITFSFHVEAKDVIRCYMFWNGQAHRFYPQDIVQAFKIVFARDRYTKFIASGAAAKIGQNINIKDQQFEYFYNSLIKDKKFPNPNILTKK